MQIIHVSSEFAPIAKIGGLADVLLGLSRELTAEGYDVAVVIPKYDCMDIEQIRDLHIYESGWNVEFDGEICKNSLWQGWVDNIKVYLIDPHSKKLFFNRGCIYGCKDDVDRYLYFSKACMEFFLLKNWQPEVLHLHDWHTAVIGPLIHEYYQNTALKDSKSIFTIHNLSYQGKCKPEHLDKLGLNGRSFLKPKKMQDVKDPKVINLMKGGIVYSDHITTVSNTYAREIQTKEFGQGLGDLLALNEHKLSGIINGVDNTYWNPETDPYIPAHFSYREEPSSSSDVATIDRKGYVKNVLRERLMLDIKHRPLVGCVSRLVPQKGVELMRHALNRTLELKGQFVLLGSSPDPDINREFHELMNQFSLHPHCRLILQHEEHLAHMIFAASDMFIVPSLFEPCGLTQMIAMKYGSVPIVRKTGGLADTVFDVSHSDLPQDRRNGFVFEDPTPKGVNSALDRAIQLWYDEPFAWRKLMQNGMQIDFSWKIPTEYYVSLYKNLHNHHVYNL